MISRYKKVTCVVILSLFLTGCWDYRDVNKRSILLSTGIDNVNDNVEFSGEGAKLAASSSKNSTTSQITDVYYFSAVGKYFEKARDDFDVQIPAPDFPGALRANVFSKKYAEKDGIESYINRVYFISQFRNSVLVVISKEPTSQLFKGKIENDICIGYAIEDTIRYLSEGGAALYKTIQEIKSDIDFKAVGYLLPYVTREKDTVKYLGLAVMKDSKLVGIIKSGDSTGVLFLLSKNPINENVIPNPIDKKKLLSIKTTLSKRSIKTSYEDKKVNIYVDLKLDSQLQYEYSIQPLSKEDMKKVEEIVSDRIKEDIMSAMERSQNEFKCDVFGFARYFKAQNSQEYKKINWKEEYPKANFNVNVETTIKNTNLLDPNAEKPN
jgi:spore germination protein KC